MQAQAAFRSGGKTKAEPVGSRYYHPLNPIFTLSALSPRARVVAYIYLIRCSFLITSLPFLMSSTSTGVNDLEGIPPAPWDVEGRLWMMFFDSPNSPNGVIPPSAYAPHDRQTSYGSSTPTGSFRGGGGCVILMRYSKTDVGPYDELTYMPGSFVYPGTGELASRVTTIYVSNEKALRAGRRVYATPKTLARFSFTTDSTSNSTFVAVSSPDDPDAKPFFSCTLTPVRFVPSLYIPRSVSPWPRLIQPPIPPPEDPKSIMLGCPHWVEVRPSVPLNGWLRLSWVQGELSGGDIADGKSFAHFQPGRWAFELTGFVGIFPIEKILGADGKSSN